MGRRGKGRTAKGAARGRLGMGFGKKSKNEAGDLLDRQEEDIERLRKKTAAELHEKELAKQPHTLVIHRGQVGKYVKGLEMDLRNIMSPNTAKNLKIRKNNNVKDFLVNGVVMGVTNMMILTASEKSLQLRMMRFSQGPTLTFRVKQYSISRHVLSAQKRPVVFEKLFQRLPLVVMNGFTKGSKHLQLVQTYIQNMFPSLNVDTIDLRDVKRCLMVNYNEEDDTVDIRHYALRVVASGLSKSSKKLVQAGKSSTKALPDLSRYKDISDYFLNPGQLSDSEFEGEQQEVELGQDIHTKGGCVRGEKSNVRLMEIGPRLSLELLKIEEGIDEGEVLYHKFIEKSSEEILQTRKQAPIQQRIKKRRETEEQQRVIRRLTAAQERRDREEAEVKAIIEKAARKQAAATGQAEDIENQKEKDREIAMNRERDLKRDGEENANEDEAPMKRRRMGPHARSSGGFGNRGGDRFSGGFEEGGSSRGGWRNGEETSSRGGRGFGGDRGGFRGRGGDGGFRGRGGDGGFRGRGGDRGGFRGRGGDGGFRGRGGSDGGFRGRGGGRGFGGRGGGRGDRDSGSSFRGRRGSF